MTLVDTSIARLDLLKFSGLKTLKLRNNSLLHCSRVVVGPGVLLAEDCRGFETTLLPLFTTTVVGVQTTQRENTVTTAIVGQVSRGLALSTRLAGGITLEATAGSTQAGTTIADTASVSTGLAGRVTSETTRGSTQPVTILADTKSTLSDRSGSWTKNSAPATDATVSVYTLTTTRDAVDYTTTDSIELLVGMNVGVVVLTSVSASLTLITLVGIMLYLNKRGVFRRRNPRRSSQLSLREVGYIANEDSMSWCSENINYRVGAIDEPQVEVAL